MSINTENATAVVANGAGNTVEPVEAPKKKGREKQTVPADNSELEMLKQQLQLQQQQIAMLLKAQNTPKVSNQRSILSEEIDEFFAAKKKSPVFTLKRELSPKGYQYVPFREDGACGDFTIEGNKKDDLVTFVYKKNTPDTAKGEGCKAFNSSTIIHKTRVIKPDDWIRAQGEMIYKFNSGVGHIRHIIVGM